VSSFQLVKPRYSEESGGLIRGVGRTDQRSRAAYSEESGVPPGTGPNWQQSIQRSRAYGLKASHVPPAFPRFIQRSGAYLAVAFRAVLRIVSYRSRPAV
jgi:hypothetical protein